MEYLISGLSINSKDFRNFFFDIILFNKLYLLCQIWKKFYKIIFQCGKSDSLKYVQPVQVRPVGQPLPAQLAGNLPHIPTQVQCDPLNCGLGRRLYDSKHCAAHTNIHISLK